MQEEFLGDIIDADIPSLIRMLQQTATFFDPTMNSQHSYMLNQIDIFEMSSNTDDLYLMDEEKSQLPLQTSQQTSQQTPIIQSSIQKKENKKVSKQRYLKNIPGYILSKAFKGFKKVYKIKAMEICKDHSVDYQSVKKFCLQKAHNINGISTLKKVFLSDKQTAENKINDKAIYQKLALLEFIQWFVKNRYVRHLILQGRMQEQIIYIKEKNRFFPKEITETRKKLKEFLSK